MLNFKVAGKVIHHLPQEEENWNICEEAQWRAKKVKLGLNSGKISSECVLIVLGDGPFSVEKGRHNGTHPA